MQTSDYLNPSIIVQVVPISEALKIDSDSALGQIIVSNSARLYKHKVLFVMCQIAPISEVLFSSCLNCC